MNRGCSLLLTALMCTLTGCLFSSQKRAIQNGEKAVSEGHTKEAVKYFDDAVHGDDTEMALEAARRAARIEHFDLKNYAKAIEYYRFLVVASDNDQERRLAQKSIAQIYFENLLYYDKAIIEYEKLLRLDFPKEEKYQFRLNIAKSDHQLGNFDQALAEIEDLSKEKLNDNDYYDLQVFKANLMMSQKKQADAIQVFADLIKKFPERAQKESLALTMAVSYEEMGDFKAAIDTLSAMKKGYSHPEFLDMRIERLQARQRNMPGAFGLKK
jgi:tetratricopeptide (TPR) repeat protein